MSGTVEQKVLTRDEIRQKVLATRAPDKTIVEFFGADIELRQPSLDDILKARAAEDNESVVIQTLMTYAYVPGSDEKVFEEADKQQLLSHPFGPDYSRVVKALESLTDVNFSAKKTDS